MTRGAMAFFVFTDSRGEKPRVRMRGIRYLDSFRESPKGVYGPFGFRRDAEAWIAENFPAAAQVKEAGE